MNSENNDDFSDVHPAVLSMHNCCSLAVEALQKVGISDEVIADGCMLWFALRARHLIGPLALAVHLEQVAAKLREHAGDDKRNN